MDLPALQIPDDGKLAANITHFARALRRAGLKIGPGRVVEAIRAVAAVGFTEKADFFWTLHASFVSRPEERQVFEQVFRLYWRDPRFLEQMMSMMLPQVKGTQPDRKAEAAEKRAAEALLDGAGPKVPRREVKDEVEEIEIDASATASAEERLRTLDFEQMSITELAVARRAIAKLTLPVKQIQSRRTSPSPHGARADWRGTMRTSLRRGVKSPPSQGKNRRRNGPIWWRSATFPEACRPTAGWCCISCMR